MSGVMASLHSIKTVPVTDQPPSVLEALPREVRDNIFHHLLFSQKDMYPYDYATPENKSRCSHHQKTPPDLAITLVNKLFYAEATTILYSRATFHLKTGILFPQFFGPIYRHSDNGWRHPLLLQKDVFPSRHLIRKLTIEFVPEHVPLGAIKHMWAEHDFSELSGHGRKEHLHYLACGANLEAWQDMFKIVRGLPGIKHVVVDIEGMMCAHGCCRLAFDAEEVFGVGLKKGGLRFGVKGQLRAGENAMVAKALRVAGYVAFYESSGDLDIPDDNGDSDASSEGDGWYDSQDDDEDGEVDMESSEIGDMEDEDVEGEASESAVDD